jgi:heme exporter protein B
MKNFFRLLRHDLRLHMRSSSEWASLILFFLIVIFLLPFALGPEPDLLRRLAPGLIWLAALLMSLLSLEKLLVQDSRDGTLDLMRLSPLPLPLLIAAKLWAQSLAMLAALSAMLFPAAILLDMPWASMPVLALTFVLGVPVLVQLGGIIAAITIGLARNPALLTLLLIPFYTPVLIFATSACDAVAAGASPQPHLLLLAALLVVTLPAPLLIAAILRQD